MHSIISLYLISRYTTVFADDSISISSSCNDKETDGLYYIKPSKEGAIIPVICSDGFTMLDPSLNVTETSTYFTSTYRYGDAETPRLYGTDCSESSGWRDWYIPAKDTTQFRVAFNCLQCEAGEVFGDNTAYYMTNEYVCNTMIDEDGCDDSIDNDPFCNICDDQQGLCGMSAAREGEFTGKWCDCFSLQLSADHTTDRVHADYCQASQGITWRPSFAIDRSQCTCYKPEESEDHIYHDVDMSDLPLVSIKYRQDLYDLGLYIDDLIQWEEDNAVSHDICGQKHTYLSNEDFKFGTYRIKNCGNYILTEDIIINFNAPSKEFSYHDGESPNSYNMNDLYWYPTTEQQESGQYFGYDAFWGPFTTGFFAAITIETNHVYIDLNGHSISMDREFYLQQRVFAHIELGNKQFNAKQGPVDFGRDDIAIKDIAIKNGVLGLSSHHGIHGGGARQVLISNLKVQHFDVGGIQCNGCKYLIIENAEVGPQNTDIPVLGRYAQSRLMLSRLRYFVDEYGDEPVRFANRHKEGQKIPKVKDLADRLVEQLDLIYYHVIQDMEFDEYDAQWIAAKKTFLNPTGWMDGGSSYGILLNGEGSAVVNIGRRTEGTWKNEIRNVVIHDIKNKPRENFWALTAQNDQIVRGFFFETLDWHYGGIYGKEDGLYVGDAYTDLLFAANKYLRDEFCPLGSLFYLDSLADWAFLDGRNLFDPSDPVEFKCGSDIQSHASKGAMGIRIDGTQDFTLDNIHIHDIENWGELGSDACGGYEEMDFFTGIDVDKDIQYGYSGNNVHGILIDYAMGTIGNVKIGNIQSWYGSSMAIAIYKGSDATFTGEISIDNIIAGQKLAKHESDNLVLPNAKPFVCSIFIGPNSDEDTDSEVTPIVKVDENEFNLLLTDKMYGYDYCLTESSRVGAMNQPLTPETILNVEKREESKSNDNSNGMVTVQNMIDNYYALIAGMVLCAFVAVLFCINKVLVAWLCNDVEEQRKKLPLCQTTYGSI